MKRTCVQEYTEHLFYRQVGKIVEEIKNRWGPPPSHVIGYRTKDAKLGVYSYFAPGTIQIEQQGQEAELYNYQQDGIDEVINHSPSGSAPDPTLFASMDDALFNPDTGAVATELRQPLPSDLQAVQTQAINDYLAYEALAQGSYFQYMPIAEK